MLRPLRRQPLMSLSTSAQSLPEPSAPNSAELATRFGVLLPHDQTVANKFALVSYLELYITSHRGETTGGAGEALGIPVSACL